SKEEVPLPEAPGKLDAWGIEGLKFIPSCFQTLNLSVIESLLGIMQALLILLFDSQLVLSRV
ncbi:MAG TPA: hypothetical protein VFF47_01770, partial [Nitrospirota bacterium]|nr:hypothetical protein [Nitrospirota bacterium]